MSKRRGRKTNSQNENYSPGRKLVPVMWAQRPRASLDEPFPTHAGGAVGARGPGRAAHIPRAFGHMHTARALPGQIRLYQGEATSSPRQPGSQP